MLSWPAVLLPALAVGAGLAALWYAGPWRRRWRGRRDGLARLLADAGVVPAGDLAEAEAFVRFRPLPVSDAGKGGAGGAPAGEPFYAFVVFEGRALRVLAVEPFVAEAFRLDEAAAGCDRCDHCAAAWACGGRDFPLRLWVRGRERRYRVRALGGRNAGAAARTQSRFRRRLAAGGGERRP